MHEARAATKQARGQGTHGPHLYRQTLSDVAVEEVRLEMALRRAVEQRELDVAYQPIVALDDGHLLGFETLVRWNDPGRGPVSPAVFVPLAERNGLIVPLGRFVLEKAMQQLGAWNHELEDTPPLLVSINLSAHQVADPGLVEFVARSLEHSGVSPRMVKIELTESALVEVPELHRRLEAFKEMGLQILGGRFRHRVLLSRASAAVRGGRDQARQGVRRPARRHPRQRHHGPHDRGPGARLRALVGGRGHRERGPGPPAPRFSGARRARATCSPPRWASARPTGSRSAAPGSPNGVLDPREWREMIARWRGGTGRPGRGTCG